VRAAVLGSPVGHSLSPLLHRAAYRELGLADWTYDAVDVTEPELPGFLAGLGPEWAGLSLTMPLKTAVLPLLDEVSPLAGVTGSVNTVLLRDGRRLGDNTDVAGLCLALDRVGGGRGGRAVVLGGGATARSALAALNDRVNEVVAYVREPARAQALFDVSSALGVRLDVRRWGDGVDLSADLVVNTTPKGAADVIAVDVPPGPSALVEVLYDPRPTALAAAWARAGGRVVDGLVMLVGQAVEQVRLMTAAEFDRAALIGTLERSLKIA
jgi:shikimate dehydrogenase